MQLPRRLLLPALLAIILLGILSLFSNRWPAIAQEKNNMQPLIKNMKTKCYGRFLLDIPQSSVDTKGDNYGFEFAEIRIDKAPYSEGLFNISIDTLEENYQKKKTFEEQPFLVHSEKLENGMRWIAYLDDELGVGFQTRGFVLKDKTLFRVEAHGFEDEDLTNFRRNFLGLAPHFKPLPPDVIPSGPGFCMTGGYVDRESKRAETLNHGFELSEQPEIYFWIHTNINGEKVDEGIYDRLPNILKNFEYFSVPNTTIRKGRRTINGLAAQEWINKIKKGDFYEYEFQLDIPGKPKSIREPWVSLGMTIQGIETNGERAPIKMTEAEALLLWDAVTKTLRPRPGAF